MTPTGLYRLQLPAVVSFSGGRTSGFMLRNILDAHQGQPDGLKVCFANTGLEHQATLDFVRDVGANWGVDITWLEYAWDEGHSYKHVTWETAARKGEPFTEMLARKSMLPNPRSRTCTSNLKMRVTDRYLRALEGFSEGYDNALGLRHDEPRRVSRVSADNSRENVVCPMDRAKHTEEDVLAFWKQQPFDLMLPGDGNSYGNCVGCFLKQTGKLVRIMKAEPEHFDWWVEAERKAESTASGLGKRFRMDRPDYAALLDYSRRQQAFSFDDPDPGLPCNCTD